MKKILISLILCLSLFSPTFAENAECKNPPADGTYVEVKVTEYIPGACCDGNAETGYTCKVKKGFGSVVDMFGGMIKYFTFIVGLAGVLYIVINGILYSMGGMEQSMKDEAKKRIVQTLIGLVLLFLTGFILNTIAPWIYK